MISNHVANHILLEVGIILAAGTLSGIVARKFRAPDLVFFLLAGIVLGPEMTGILNVRPESTFNQLILIFGSCYILFDGGATLKLSVLKEVWLTLVVISTLGVLITASITGLAAIGILGVPLITALLLGASLASTDPATLIPVFNQVRIRERVAQTVVGESAFNDAVSAIVTFALLGVALGTGGKLSPGAMALELAANALIGIAAGAALGYAAAFLIAHERFGFLIKYAPLVTLMAVVGAFLSAETLNASGFMAVFVFGVMLGNKEMFGFRQERGERERLADFIGTTTLIMRMFIFILLGSQVNFSLIGEHLVGGLLLVLVFMFVARPVTVFACALPDRKAKWSLRELLFICWTRETGVIPGALAGILVGMRAPGAEVIASVTFLTILLTIMIQATTARWMAGKLGLLNEK
ncbi:MAG TPA: cation:proton antiporter [Geobacteraceae bacterium]|nr:cation:proton antiporter [Geobacteraceae bacterium]